MKRTKPAGQKPRLVGMNHVALEVGSVADALAFYGRIFAFTLRGRGRGQAFIDMGDQFVALMEVKEPHRDQARHFGVVVDDRSRVIELAQAAGAIQVPGPFLDFLDPWGNRFEVIEYARIQFTKAPHVLRGMGLRLAKSDAARQELAAKGMAPPGRKRVPARPTKTPARRTARRASAAR
jgi:catechol 2,3-dioxygenase-like lactoylglutathione lyase family enzyme